MIIASILDIIFNFLSGIYLGEVFSAKLPATAIVPLPASATLGEVPQIFALNCPR
jgi:hypothetical protein